MTSYCLLYIEKYKKIPIKTMNLKYQYQHGTGNSNYLMDYILYRIFIDMYMKISGWNSNTEY